MLSSQQTEMLSLFWRAPSVTPITNKAITRETVIPDFEIGTFFQNFRIGPIFQFNLNIWEGEENAGAIQSVPADRGIIISRIILKT